MVSFELHFQIELNRFLELFYDKSIIDYREASTTYSCFMKLTLRCIFLILASSIKVFFGCIKYKHATVYG